VDHIIVLDKWEFYGMTGFFYNLFKSYFEHKYQRVQIGTKFNDTELESIRNGYCKDQSLVLQYFLYTLN